MRKNSCYQLCIVVKQLTVLSFFSLFSLIVQQIQEVRTTLKPTTEKSISVSTKEHTIPRIEATTPRSLMRVLFDAPSKQIQFHYPDTKGISTAKTTKDSVRAKQSNPQYLEQKKSSLKKIRKSYMDLYKKLKDWGTQMHFWLTQLHTPITCLIK